MQRITSISICNVKSVKQKQIDIKAPVVFISGDHRSGKSAISQAIQFAIFGKSDEIGQRGVGALIAGSTGTAEVSVWTDQTLFQATASVSAKGTVSQKRMASPIGSLGSILIDESVEQLLGAVPVTINQLLSLSGEQLWQLAMPSDQSMVVADYIVKAVADVDAKVKSLGLVGLSLKVTADAIAEDSAGFIEGLTEVKKGVQSQVKLLQEQAKAAATLAPYSGPPIADLKKDLEAIVSVINELTKNLSDRKRNADLFTQKEAEVAKIAAAKTAEEGRLKSQRETLDALIAAMERATRFKERCTDTYIFPKDGENLCVSVDSLFQPRMAEIISTHRDQFPESRFSKSIDMMIEELREIVSEMIYRPDDDPLLDAMIAEAIKGSEVLRPLNAELTASALLNDGEFEVWSKKIATGRQMTESAIVQSAALVESQKLKLKELTKQRDEAKRLSELKIDSSRMEELAEKKKLLESQIEEAEKTTKAMSSSVASRARVGEMASVISSIEQAIANIQEYRRDALETGLRMIEQYANRIVQECGLTPLKITAGGGKRPALIIANSNNIVLSAMSGAERLVAGAAIIRALQRIRNVVLPLLFLEGGEVNSLMTLSLLTSLADFGKDMGGHVFMCHWLELDEFDLEKVQVIHA